ncbi:MAG: plastocyanin/azurin family copper-binding protein [Actinomycetota bacterium]
MTRHRARIAWVAVATAGALGLVAVALRADATPGPGEVREVRIVIHHSRFNPGDVKVAPGATVRFVLENNDPIDHEFIVGDARVQLVHERGTEAHHPPKPGEITVPADATRSTTVTFPRSPRTTLFGCHLPGHYAYGMAGTIEIG